MPAAEIVDLASRRAATQKIVVNPPQGELDLATFPTTAELAHLPPAEREKQLLRFETMLSWLLRSGRRVLVEIAEDDEELVEVFAQARVQ